MLVDKINKNKNIYHEKITDEIKTSNKIVYFKNDTKKNKENLFDSINFSSCSKSDFPYINYFFIIISRSLFPKRIFISIHELVT